MMDIDLNIGLLTVNPDKPTIAAPEQVDEISLPEIDFTALVDDAPRQDPDQDPDVLQAVVPLVPVPAVATDFVSKDIKPDVDTVSPIIVSGAPSPSRHTAEPAQNQPAKAPLPALNGVPTEVIDKATTMLPRPVIETPAPDHTARRAVEVQPDTTQPQPAAHQATQLSRNPATAPAVSAPINTTPPAFSEPAEALESADLRPLTRSEQPQTRAAVKSVLPQMGQTLTPTLTKTKTLAEDSNPELTVGIKIERQSAEIAPKSHSISHAAPPLPTQIGTQLHQQISTADKQRIELRLDPPELGRVTVHLTTHDRTVTALVSADRADTVDLMRRHAEVLTATLEKAGFSQTNLSFQQGRADQGQKNSAGFSSFNFSSEPPENTDVPVQNTRLDGRLDIRL